MREENWFIYVFLALAAECFSTINAGTISTVQLTPSVTTVGELSNYTFLIQGIPTTTPDFSKIKIIFPTSFYSITTTSYPCLGITNANSLLSCSGSSVDNSITVSNIGSYSRSLILFAINGTRNPPSTLITQSLQLFTLDASSTAIDNKTTSIVPALTPGMLQSASVSSLSQIAGAISYLQLQFTPQHSIPVGSTIKITLPKYNSQEGAQAFQVRSMISTSIPNCTAVSGIGANLTCSFDSSIDQLTVSGGYTSSGNTNLAQISFTVNSFTNPFSTRPKGNFTILTQASSGGNIDIISGLTLTVSQAGTLVPSTFTLESYVINVATTYTFSTSCPNIIEAGSTMQIQFPTGVTFNSNTSSINPLSGLDSSLTTNFTTNQITVLQAFNSYQEAEASIFFQILNVNNPATTRPTPGFSIIIKDSQGYLSQQVLNSSQLQVTAAPANINNAQLKPSSTVVNQKTSYIFSFKPTSSLPSTGAIYIYFPSQVMLDSRNTTCLANANLQGISSSATCISDISTLLIQNPFPKGYTSGTTLSIEIPNVKNPSSTQPPSAFSIETWDNLKTSSGAIIDQTTNLVLSTSLSPGAINGTNTLTVSNATTGVPTIYTFSFILTDSILQNGYLQIILPNFVSIDPGALISNTMGFSTSPSLSVNSTANSFNITNGFLVSSSMQNADLAFSVSGITNPRSSAPLTNFMIATYDPSAYIIDQVSPSPTVTMTTAVNLDAKTTVNPSSFVNSMQADYTITIYPTIPLLSSDTIAITFPASIGLSSSVQCTTTDPGIQAITNCNYNPPSSVNISLNFESSPMKNGFSVKLKNVVNSISTKPSNSIQITTADSSGYFSQQMLSGLVVTTTTAADISSKVSISAASLQINTSTAYIFIVSTTVDLPQNYYILITLPSAIAVQSGLQISNVSSNLGTPTIQVSNQKIKTSLLPQVSSGKTLNFTLDTLTNPPDTTSSWVITVEFYTIDDYIIQSTFNGVSLTYTCGTKCATCSGIPTNCTACQVTYPLYYPNDCFTSCPDGTTDNGTQVCVNCDPLSRCKSCQISNLSTCLTCLASFPLLNSIDQRCYSSCPQGSYQPTGQDVCAICGTGSNCASCNASDSMQCFSCLPSYPLFSEIDSKCYNNSCPDGTAISTTDNRCVVCTSSSNCKTCSITSLSACTSCPNIYPYLSQIDNTCNAQCPNQTAATNINGSYICQQCTLDSHCNTCQSTNLSVCQSCLPTYPYFGLDDKICYETCPLGYSQVGSNCIICSTNCKYCNSGDINYCIACQSPTPYLNVVTHSCVSSCESPYFLDSSGTQCTTCNASANCATCSASNTNFCLTCAPPYPIFYPANGWCYSTCPTGSFYDYSNQNCQSCSPTCQTCEGSANNCTSCNGVTPYLLNSTCVTICPSGYKTDAKTGTNCVPETCDPQCQPSCSPPAYDSSLSQCICASGYSVWSGNETCIGTCPVGYYSSTRRICTQCFSGCLACTSETNCTKCNGTQFVYDLSCVDSCPTGYYLFQSVCLNYCSYYLFGSDCLITCPDGMVGDDTTKQCVNLKAKVGPIAPFFLALALVMLFCLFRIERKHKENLFFSNAIALLSVIEPLSWIMLLVLYFIEGFPPEGGLVTGSVAICFLLNRIFMRLYHKRILGYDSNYVAWRTVFLKRVRVIECVSTFYSLRFLRVVFGRMCKGRFTRAHFGREKEAKKLFNNFALACVLVGNFPVLVSNFLSFSSVIKRSQLFISIIETSILSTFMILFTTFSYTVYSNDGFEEVGGSGIVPRINIFAAQNYKTRNDSVLIDIEKTKIGQEIRQGTMEKSTDKSLKPFMIIGVTEGENFCQKKVNNLLKDFKEGQDSSENPVESSKQEKPVQFGNPVKNQGHNHQLQDSTFVQKIEDPDVLKRSLHAALNVQKEDLENIRIDTAPSDRNKAHQDLNDSNLNESRAGLFLNEPLIDDHQNRILHNGSSINNSETQIWNYQGESADHNRYLSTTTTKNIRQDYFQRNNFSKPEKGGGSKKDVSAKNDHEQNQTKKAKRKDANSRSPLKNKITNDSIGLTQNEEKNQFSASDGFGIANEELFVEKSSHQGHKGSAGSNRSSPKGKVTTQSTQKRKPGKSNSQRRIRQAKPDVTMREHSSDNITINPNKSPNLKNIGESKSRNTPNSRKIAENLFSAKNNAVRTLSIDISDPNQRPSTQDNGKSPVSLAHQANKHPKYSPHSPKRNRNLAGNNDLEDTLQNSDSIVANDLNTNYSKKQKNESQVSKHMMTAKTGLEKKKNLRGSTIQSFTSKKATKASQSSKNSLMKTPKNAKVSLENHENHENQAEEEPDERSNLSQPELMNEDPEFKESAIDPFELAQTTPSMKIPASPNRRAKSSDSSSIHFSRRRKKKQKESLKEDQPSHRSDIQEEGGGQENEEREEGRIVDFSMFPFGRPPAKKPNIKEYIKRSSPKRQFQFQVTTSDNNKQRSKPNSSTSNPKQRRKFDKLTQEHTTVFDKMKLKEAFSKDDNEITRLLKATMINTNYKRNLATNQVTTKSNYAYDEMKKNPANVVEYDKNKSQLMSEVKEIKNNRINQNDVGIFRASSRNTTNLNFHPNSTEEKFNKSLEEQINMNQDQSFLPSNLISPTNHLQIETITKQHYDNQNKNFMGFHNDDDDNLAKNDAQFTTPKANSKISQNFESSKGLGFLEDF